jgi:cytochrome c-type biogenesis protein CcmH
VARSPSPLLIWPLAAAIAAVSLAIGFYVLLDRPIAVERSSTEMAAGSPATTAVTRQDLVAHLARHPDDGRSWVLLARLDFGADRFADAANAYERALAASAKVGADPVVWCEYADALGMVNGGSLAGRPRELVMRALARDPKHPKALEMAGSAAFEAHEYASALGYWRTLLPQFPADSTARRELAAAIRKTEQLALETPPSAADR